MKDKFEKIPSPEEVWLQVYLAKCAVPGNIPEACANWADHASRAYVERFVTSAHLNAAPRQGSPIWKSLLNAPADAIGEPQAEPPRTPGCAPDVRATMEQRMREMRAERRV